MHHPYRIIYNDEDETYCLIYIDENHRFSRRLSNVGWDNVIVLAAVNPKLKSIIWNKKAADILPGLSGDTSLSDLF